MSVSDFVKNFKALHPEGSWPEERLKKVYYSIKKCELGYPPPSHFYQNSFCRPDSLPPGAGADTSRSLSRKIKTLLRQERGKGARFSTITVTLTTPRDDTRSEAHRSSLLAKESFVALQGFCKVNYKFVDLRKKWEGTFRPFKKWSLFWMTLRPPYLEFYIPEKFKDKRLYYRITVHHSFSKIPKVNHANRFVFCGNDGREIYISCESSEKCSEWLNAINKTAAYVSMSPLGRPIGTKPTTFQRPILPTTDSQGIRTRQISMCKRQIASFETELRELLNSPQKNVRERLNDAKVKYWMDNLDYVQYELERYRTYLKLLCTNGG
ncbi:PH and SEC7 domain-containing protein-like [Zophobas morio]|uniref:PH and SEC7 domain-containing protein-like n=1 Tax=Zophobas morio TaxID=2755281 RepID=UPI003083E8ED